MTDEERNAFCNMVHKTSTEINHKHFEDGYLHCISDVRDYISNNPNLSADDVMDISMFLKERENYYANR